MGMLFECVAKINCKVVFKTTPVKLRENSDLDL